MNYQLSELDRHEFSGIRSLIAAVQANRAKYEVYDFDGNRVELDIIENKCRKTASIIAGYVIVDDGDPSVFKRYVIKTYAQISCDQKSILGIRTHIND